MLVSSTKKALLTSFSLVLDSRRNSLLELKLELALTPSSTLCSRAPQEVIWETAHGFAIESGCNSTYKGAAFLLILELLLATVMSQ